MWEIQKTANGQWEISTEVFLTDGVYDASGVYQTKRAAIEAATLEGDGYVILRPATPNQPCKPGEAARGRLR